MQSTALLDQLSEGVIVLADQGDILFVNTSAANLLGLNGKDMIGAVVKPGQPIRVHKTAGPPGEERLYKLSTSGTSIDWDGCKATLHLVETNNHPDRFNQAEDTRLPNFMSFFDQQLIGFAVISLDLRIVEANEKFCRILGYSQSEIKEKSWYELAPEPDLGLSLGIQVDGLQTGHFEKRFISRQGSHLHAVVSIDCIKNPDNTIKFYTLLAEDISEHRKTSEKLKRQNKYLEALHETTLGLINHANMDELLEQIVLHANQLIGTPSGYIYTYDPKSANMYVRVGFGLFEGYSGFQIKKGDGLAGKVWETGGIMIVDDYDTWEGRNPDLPAMGFHAGIALPLTAGGTVVGAIGLSSPQTGNIFTVEEIEILKRFSQLASVVLNNALSHEEAQKQLIITQQRESELQALASVSAALRTASNRSEISTIILEQIMLLINSIGAALVLIDHSTGDLVIENAMGILEGETGKTISSLDGIGSGVLEIPFSGQLDNIQSIFELGLNTGISPQDEIDTNTAVCIPLSVRNSPMGVIWIIRHNQFNEPEMRLLISIANITANAINRTTLHEKTNQQLQNILALHRIDLAINTSHELIETSSVILEQVIEQLGVDAADILLYNPQKKTLDYIYGKGFITDKRNQSIGVDESLAGNAVKLKRIMHVPDMHKEDGPVCAFCNREENFLSYFAAPLLVGGDVKGVLEVFSRVSAPHSPLQINLEERISFLNLLAGQTAIAVDNARLFTDLERSNAELYEAYDATIQGWAYALELREHETAGHSRRVVETTLQLARLMNIEEEKIPHIWRGALLHDAGKMGIPDRILLKKGPLTERQWKTMREHPVLANKMLSSINFLQPALEIPYCHHEKWDGSGYPRQLRGEEIPISARVFSIVDVWDALTSNRPYRPAWASEEAIDYIREQSGRHFDSRITDVFLKMIGGGLR